MWFKFITRLLLLVSIGANAADEDVFALIGKKDVAGLQQALQAGADPDLAQTTGYMATPLMQAASISDPAMVDVLIEAGADVNGRDKMRDTALNWAAYYGHAQVITSLLNAGADQSLAGHGTAIEITMRRGHQAALAVLIDKADKAPNRSAKEMAMAEAATLGNLATVELLIPLMNPADTKDWAGRPLILAASRTGQSEVVSAMVAAGAPVDAVDAIGFTALFEAAREGHAATVRQLLALGANVNHVSKESALSLTPLHLAAIGGDIETINVLVEASADIDARGSDGATPILWAAYEGDADAVIALINAGADPSLANEDGVTIPAIAKAYGWDAVTELLDSQQ